MIRYLAMLILAALALAPFAAGAQEFRCVGKDGKKYYGSTIPPQCLGQPVEQLNKQGRVIQRIDPEGEQKAKEAREADAAELAKKRQQDNAKKEADRRNRALLATYTSEKDIEDARKRALADSEKAMKDVQARIDGIKKRQAELQTQMASYQDPGKDAKGKPKPAAKAPPNLAEDLKNAEIDLSAQQTLLDSKKKEIEQINAKYDDDKKRYLALTQGK